MKFVKNIENIKNIIFVVFRRNTMKFGKILNFYEIC